MDSSVVNDQWIARLTGAPAVREQAIAELRSLLLRGLQKSLSTKYGSGLQADDVVQEALLKILDSLNSFEGRSRFTTWAMTIATRMGISQLRRKHFKDVSLSAMAPDDSLLPAISAEEPTAADHLDRKHVLEVLNALIETRLTERQREATQGLLDGLPVEEIAHRTGSNRNAVYKLIHDARMRLRDGFAERGITAEEVNSFYN